MILSAITDRAVYFAFAAGVYGIILAALILALVFGLRARVLVKDEYKDRLPDGFSPLDIQRVMFGRTYPSRLTKALLCHWANMGYITIKSKEDGRLAIRVLKEMPPHDAEDAAFFDRGTYVRERDIFKAVFGGRKSRELSPHKALIPFSMQSEIRKKYAVREDEGVYGQRHYSLKIIMQILALLPILLSGVWDLMNNKMGSTTPALLFVFIGILCMRYLKVVPFGIRIPFFSIWGGMPLVIYMTNYTKNLYDPLGIGIASGVFMLLGTFVLIQFADVREKNNLDDYSDIMNVKKFLRRTKREKLTSADYAALLPLLYTLPSMRLYKGKFRDCMPPTWFSGERGLA